MTNDAKKTEEYEMVDAATQQPDSGQEGQPRRAPNSQFMETVKAHITKLLSVLILMLLGLAVAALQKQLNFSNGYDTIKKDIVGLQQTASAAPEMIQSHVSDIFQTWDDDPPPVVDNVYEQIHALNTSIIIRNEWIRTEGDLYFHKFSQRVTYQEASQYCIRWTGGLAVQALASPHLLRYVSNSSAWVGYKRNNGIWNGVDGDGIDSTLLLINDITTTDSSSQIDCGYIQGDNDGKLHLKSALCNQTMSYVCEVDVNYAY